MASLEEIQQILTRIEEELPSLIQRSQITPKQIAIMNGLSDISERLGLVMAGEFRSGNGVEPGFGFSGVRIGYPPFSYDSELWNIVGIEDDVLQIGIRASDGKLVFGGGDGFLDGQGLNIKNQEGAINFQDATTDSYEKVIIYIDGDDELVLKNAVGGSASGVRFDVDTPAHVVMQYIFEYDQAIFPADVTIDGALTVGRVRTDLIASLQDNQAGSVTAPDAVGGVIVYAAGTGFGGLVFYNVITPDIGLVMGGAGLEVTTGALSGVTGTDGKLTISAHTDGKVHVENRMGLTRNIILLFI